MTAIDEQESVAAIARAACVSGHAAVLCAEIPGDVGYLFFLKGELVHASSLDLEGEAAAVEILGWQGASVGWCERRWPRERTVLRDIDELVDLGAQRASSGISSLERDEEEDLPPPESQARVTSPSTAPLAGVRFPTAAGVSRALLNDGFKNGLSVHGSGLVGETRGSYQHLKAVIWATTALGDLFGESLGLGPLLAAEASTRTFHRIVARSNDGTTAAETTGGSALSVARAFFKL